MKGMFFINFYWLMDASGLWDAFHDWDEYKKVSQETRDVMSNYAKWWITQYTRLL